MADGLDWRDVVRADVDALPEPKRRAAPGDTTVNLKIMGAAVDRIEEAAAARRLNAQSYIRRAAMAMAAYDLGIPLRELTELDPRMVRETGFRVDDPTGEAFGPWRIEGLA